MNAGSLDSRSFPPTSEDLTLLGLERWKIASIQSMPHSVQWAIHDEIIRKFMTGEDTDNIEF